METRQFYNDELLHVSELAKNNGFQVWTFESTGSIKQVFITDGKNIGTCSADFSGVHFGTVHKPNRQCGTGFGLQSDHIINSTIDNIKESFCFAPHWATRKDMEAVKKYASWDEFLQEKTILKYYQL